MWFQTRHRFSSSAQLDTKDASQRERATRQTDQQDDAMVCWVGLFLLFIKDEDSTCVAVPLQLSTGEALVSATNFWAAFLTSFLGPIAPWIFITATTSSRAKTLLKPYVRSSASDRNPNGIVAITPLYSALTPPLVLSKRWPAQ